MNNATGDTPATAVRAPARAAVCTGGVETEYIRMGRGEPIVMVVADLDAVEVTEMTARLAMHYMVLVAAPRLDPGQIAGWMRDFLEGLGLAQAHLMVHARLMDTTTEI
ncbi:MAG TPA: hypothetical protein VFZ73_01075 [Gemmatimonadaceae bacterium]